MHVHAVYVSTIKASQRAALLVILFSKAPTFMSTQGRYFLITQSFQYAPYTEYPHIDGIDYLKGQLELGANGFLHWQLVAYFSRKRRLGAVKRLFLGNPHVECVRDRDRAIAYVWKDESSQGFRFEHGCLPFNRSNNVDWDTVRSNASSGDLDSIPSDIAIRYYNNLRRIMTDKWEPTNRSGISVQIFYGLPGTGKTRLAQSLAGTPCYWKTPTTKWWDGYKGEKAVIIDDFDGESIGYTHLKRWFDRFPCQVETKGGAVPLCAETFFVTSNVAPQLWFPKANVVHVNAILRRCQVFEIDSNLPWVYNVE